MFHIGHGNYGTIDVVPGLFSVQTRFIHFNFFPLIPIRSHLLLESRPDQPIPFEIPIRMSFKSVLFAYLRAMTILAIATAVISFFVILVEAATEKVGRGGETPTHLLIALGFVAATVGVYYASYAFGRASIEHAIDLGARLGFSTEEVEDHFFKRQHF